MYMNATGGLVFIIGDGVAGSPMIAKGFGSGYDDNTWHHLVTVADRSGDATYYVDGTEIGTFDISGESGDLSSAYPLVMGVNHNDGLYNNLFYPGQIDEVYVFNRTLSPEEINDTRDFGNVTDYVAYWSFDEREGYTASDASANGNDATLMNGTRYSTVVLTSASQPPSNYWDFDTNMDVTADYSIFRYYRMFRNINAGTDIDNCIFDNAGDGSNEQVYLHSTGTITSFSNNTISNNVGGRGLYVFNEDYAAFDGINISGSFSSWPMKADGANIEFTNSYFNHTRVQLDNGGNVISKDHNGVSGDYKVMASTLHSVEVTNIPDSTDALELIAGNLTILNWTLGSTRVNSTGELERQWYLDVNVTESDGSASNNADVNITNYLNASLFYGQTGADGFIVRQNSTEYNQTITSLIYWTPHTLFANQTIGGDRYIASNITNVSLERGVQVDMILEMENAAPAITIHWPANNTNTTDRTPQFNFTVTDDNNGTLPCYLFIDGVDYGFNSTVVNNTPTIFEANDTLTAADHTWFINCSDGELANVSDVRILIVNETKLTLTKGMDPEWILASSEIDMEINLTLTNSDEYGLIGINMSDEIPAEFAGPGSAALIYVNSTGANEFNITDNVTITITNTQISMNVSNSSLAIGEYFLPSDRLILSYTMKTSQMAAGDVLNIISNASATSLAGGLGNKSISTPYSSSASFLRAWKVITSDPAHPLNITVQLMLQAVGGNVSEILVADYLPAGATISSHNVTHYNWTSQETILLSNTTPGEDYLINGPISGELPDGVAADIYNLNFTTESPTNWDGILYENETLNITYTAYLIAGGDWILPTVIGGFDPTYNMNVSSTKYTHHSVPLFDVFFDIKTKEVRPGDMVVGVVTMKNVGGPLASVDLSLTYYILNSEGEMVYKGNKVIAVYDVKEELINIQLPDDIAPGLYTFHSVVVYGEMVATSVDTFRVMGFGFMEVLDRYGMLIVVILMLITMFTVLFKRRSLSKEDIRELKTELQADLKADMKADLKADMQSGSNTGLNTAGEGLK